MHEDNTNTIHNFWDFPSNGRQLLLLLKSAWFHETSRRNHVTLVAKIYSQVTLSYIAKGEGLQNGLQCIY